MTTISQWIAGSRPRTLTAVIAPIIVSLSLAAHNTSHIKCNIAILTLLLGLCIQIAINFSNDYSDGIKGTDDKRQGPIRLVGQKIAKPEHIKRVAIFFIVCSALLGITILALTGDWLLMPVGIASLFAVWFYSGGKNPYGYKGMGELFVFIFFGLVTTVGTYYLQTQTVTTHAILLGVGSGAAACCLLVSNNIRDIKTDKESGKITLAVIFGAKRTRQFYFVLLLIYAICILYISISIHTLLLLSILPIIYFGRLAFTKHNATATPTANTNIIDLPSTSMMQISSALLFSILLLFV